MANPSTSPHAGPPKPRSLRTFNRIGCLLLIVVLVTLLLVSYLAKTSAGGRRLQEEIARLKAAGVLLEPEVLIPTVPEGEKNAADVYEQAFRACHVSESERDTIWPGEDPSRMDTVRDVVARHARYFDLLDEASRIPPCAFAVDWAEPWRDTHYLAPLRQAARMLVLRAELLSADGRYDDALGCSATSFRIAEHVKIEPSLISQLVAYAIQSITLASLADTLSAGTPTAEACRQLFDQLSTIDQIAPSVRAMQGELALEGMPIFDLAHSQRVHALAPFTNLPERVLAAYVSIGRPLLNADQITYLRYMEKRIAGCALAYREIGSEFEDAQAILDRAPSYALLLTSALTVPGIDGTFIREREEEAALIRCAQAALAVKAYSAAHGSYPESLADLEAAGWDLPKDPFTFPAADFHYARDQNGFRIWSVGPDMDNDGGLAMGEDDYDITFRSQQ